MTRPGQTRTSRVAIRTGRTGFSSRTSCGAVSKRGVSGRAYTVDPESPACLSLMSSLTKFAVLGLAARRPTYGYAALRQLQRWSLTGDVQRSSIYDALSRLRNDGLIQLRDEQAADGAERQPRTMYVATAQGDDVLDSWFATPPTSFDELRLRIVLAQAHHLDHLMRFVTAAEEECLTRLEELESVDIERLMTESSGRSAPAEALYEALLGSMTSIELDGRLRSLQTARVTLETLRSHPRYRTPPP